MSAQTDASTTYETGDAAPETQELLPGGELCVPSYLQGDETAGFSIVEELGDSITYHLTGEQRTEAAGRIADQINSSVAQVLADKEYYPHITDISMNQDCSEFKVTFSDDAINIYETTLPMSLYIAGDKFQLYSGKGEILTVVNYIDGSTGDIFFTGDSGELH